MSELPEPPPLPDALPPLRIDGNRTIRVAGTRVTLDVLIGAFLGGASPESLAECYDALTLAEIYSAIGYYLQNKAILDDYLQRRERFGEEMRREIEARQGPGITKAQLLARRAAKIAAT